MNLSQSLYRVPCLIRHGRVSLSTTRGLHTVLKQSANQTLQIDKHPARIHSLLTRTYSPDPSIKLCSEQVSRRCYSSKQEPGSSNDSSSDDSKDDSDYTSVAEPSVQEAAKLQNNPTGYDIKKTELNFAFDPQRDNMRDIPLFITKYSTDGFTIQGNQVFGPVCILPKGYYSWRVPSFEMITPESLSLFAVHWPAIEILVIGCGDGLRKLPADCADFLRKQRIAHEVLDTPNACATFNFLTEENRSVACAMIPPRNISFGSSGKSKGYRSF